MSLLYWITSFHSLCVSSTPSSFLNDGNVVSSTNPPTRIRELGDGDGTLPLRDEPITIPSAWLISGIWGLIFWCVYKITRKRNEFGTWNKILVGIKSKSNKTYRDPIRFMGREHRENSSPSNIGNWISIN